MPAYEVKQRVVLNVVQKIDSDTEIEERDVANIASGYTMGQFRTIGSNVTVAEIEPTDVYKAT